MGQLFPGMAATGTYSDASTADVTTLASWSVSDASIVTVGANDGLLTIQPAGSIWGATVGVTATLAPGTPGTASLLVIASDSGSVAPRMPNTNTHWQALGLSPWGSWWGLQEASGSDTLIGSGSAAFNLTRSDGGLGGDGTGLHQAVALAGWTRKGIVISGSNGQGITAAAGIGPDPSTTSWAVLGYGQIYENNSGPGFGFMGLLANTAANQSMIASANTAGNRGSIRLLTQNGSPIAVGPKSQRHSDRIHPFLYVYNRTTAEVWVYTDNVLVMSSSHVAISADDFKGFGSRPTVASPSSSWVWGAVATGSIVERLCDPVAAGDLLIRLGWNVPWKTCPTDSGTIKCPFLPHHYAELGLQPWTATWNMQDVLTLGQNSFDRFQGVSDNSWQLIGNTNTPETVYPDWNRRGVKYSSVSNARSSRTCLGQRQWDPTGSFAVITYISSSVAFVLTRGVMGQTALNGPTTFAVAQPIGSNPVLYCAGATVTASVSIFDDRFHPMLIVYDRTNSRAKYYTDIEVMTGSFNALVLQANVTASLTFGGGVNQFTSPPAMNVVWGAFCTGTLAESLSDDGRASAFLKTLGWTTVTW